MSDQNPEMCQYGGVARQVIGRLRYPSAPVPGTLLGPDGWGETVVVLGTQMENDRPTTLIGRAIKSDIEAAMLAPGFPRTDAERRISRYARTEEVLNR